VHPAPNSVAHLFRSTEIQGLRNVDGRMNSPAITTSKRIVPGQVWLVDESLKATAGTIQKIGCIPITNWA